MIYLSTLLLTNICHTILQKVYPILIRPYLIANHLCNHHI